MKTKIWLLTGCMFFSSCHSYKTMDVGMSKITEGKKYKIVTTYNKNHKIRILKYGDTLVGRKSSGVFIKFAKEDVKVIKERKFSLLKTVGLPVILTGAALGVVAITGGPNLNLDTSFLAN